MTMTLEEAYLTAMAKIGDLDSKLSVIVRTNDGGNLPHFHVLDMATLGNEFHTCICIEKPSYFIHEGKEVRLNSKQKKWLMQFFESPSEDEPEKTNWDVLLIEWNRNNSRIKVSRDIEMPDYRLL